MKENITVQNVVSKEVAPNKELIIGWAGAALKNCDSDDAELTIRIVTSDEIRQLNKKYRQKDKATNVLSFPFEAPSEIPQIAEFYLGDIAICADVVNDEAMLQKKTQDAHWAHMVVHGIYHLLGYDHQQDEEAAIMEGLETATLKALGFDDPYKTGDKIEDHE